MTYGLYSIRDVKANWLSPTGDMSDQSAIRNFAIAVRRNDIFNFAPSDFSLYRIGYFDTDTGKLTSLDVPVFLVEASDLVGDSDV